MKLFVLGLFSGFGVMAIKDIIKHTLKKNVLEYSTFKVNMKIIY